MPTETTPASNPFELLRITELYNREELEKAVLRIGAENSRLSRELENAKAERDGHFATLRRIASMAPEEKPPTYLIASFERWRIAQVARSRLLEVASPVPQNGETDR